MPNLPIFNPSQWFFQKSFNLILPPLCRPPCASVAVPPLSFKSKSRVEELRKVFCHFDSNNDGKISPEELKSFFATMGEEVPGEAAERVIDEIEFGDFLALMEEGAQEEEMKKAFESFELVKGSGRITAKGVQKVLRQLGYKRSVPECEAMIRAYDLDGNGELDFNEFHKMMS